jgi:hypothetical protein
VVRSTRRWWTGAMQTSQKAVHQKLAGIGFSTLLEEQRRMLTDRAGTVRNLIGKPDSGTPTTTPTRPETARTRPHATARKVYRISYTYGKFSLRPRAKAHRQKQTLPLSHGGGHEFESRRVHSGYSHN